MTAGEPRVEPFPRVFMVANGIELLERLAFYGVYINLQVYLINDLGISALEVGALLGVFALGRAWLPVVVGSIADRITFRVSLLIAFSTYAFAYLSLFFAPTREFAYAAIACMALGGAFMKPVITGCVTRFSPPGRQTQGFAIFYAVVNAGSVVGKVLAAQIRTRVSLRATMLTSVAASLAALFVTLFFFFEPDRAKEAEKAKSPFRIGAFLSVVWELVRSYGTALANWRLSSFLFVVSGYYLLIEQFYQTFPVHMLRTLGENAPREYITLINPLSIAVLQVFVARATKSLDPLGAMATGIAMGAASMLTMGMFPTLFGAAGSFFMFAMAEMVFSPRFYDYVSSFAPKGKEGLYMGLALVPAGMGGLVGGVLSGRLITDYLPKTGAIQPLKVWGTYAVIGVGCAVILAAYRAVVVRADVRAAS